jgi:hypothetical protein
MSSKNNKNPSDQASDLIPVSDAAFTLRLSDSGMRELLVEKKCVLVLQADGKEAITTQSFKALAHCAEAQAAAIRP